MDYNDSCTFSESHGLHGTKDERKIQVQESRAESSHRDKNVEVTTRRRITSDL